MTSSDVFPLAEGATVKVTFEGVSFHAQNVAVHNFAMPFVVDEAPDRFALTRLRSAAAAQAPLNATTMNSTQRASSWFFSAFSIAAGLTASRGLADRLPPPRTVPDAALDAARTPGGVGGSRAPPPPPPPAPPASPPAGSRLFAPTAPTGFSGTGPASMNSCLFPGQSSRTAADRFDILSTVSAAVALRTRTQVIPIAPIDALLLPPALGFAPLPAACQIEEDKATDSDVRVTDLVRAVAAGYAGITDVEDSAAAHPPARWDPEVFRFAASAPLRDVDDLLSIGRSVGCKDETAAMDSWLPPAVAVAAAENGVAFSDVAHALRRLVQTEMPQPSRQTKTTDTGPVPASRSLYSPYRLASCCTVAFPHAAPPAKLPDGASTYRVPSGARADDAIPSVAPSEHAAARLCLDNPASVVVVCHQGFCTLYGVFVDDTPPPPLDPALLKPAAASIASESSIVALQTMRFQPAFKCTALATFTTSVCYHTAVGNGPAMYSARERVATAAMHQPVFHQPLDSVGGASASPMPRQETQLPPASMNDTFSPPEPGAGNGSLPVPPRLRVPFDRFAAEAASNGPNHPDELWSIFGFSSGDVVIWSHSQGAMVKRHSTQHLWGDTAACAGPEARETLSRAVTAICRLARGDGTLPACRPATPYGWQWHGPNALDGTAKRDSSTLTPTSRPQRKPGRARFGASSPEGSDGQSECSGSPTSGQAAPSNVVPNDSLGAAVNAATYADPAADTTEVASSPAIAPGNPQTTPFCEIAIAFEHGVIAVAALNSTGGFFPQRTVWFGGAGACVQSLSCNPIMPSVLALGCADGSVRIVVYPYFTEMFAVSARTGEPGASEDPVLNAAVVVAPDGTRSIVKYTYSAAGAVPQPLQSGVDGPLEAATHQRGAAADLKALEPDIGCEPAARLVAPAREDIGGASDPRIACVVPLAVELGGVTCVAWTREGNALVCSGGDDSTSIVSFAIDPAAAFEASSAAGPVFGMGAYASLTNHRSPSPTRAAAAAGDTPPLGTSRRATTPLAFSPRPVSRHDAKSVPSQAASQVGVAASGERPPLPSGGGAAAIAHLHQWQRRQAERTDDAWRLVQTGGFTLRAVKVQRKVFHRTWVPCAACLCLDLVPPAPAAVPEGTAASALDAGARASISGAFGGTHARMLLPDQLEHTASLRPGAPRPTICVQLILSASLDGTVTAAVARRLAVPTTDASLISPTRARTRGPSLYAHAGADEAAAGGTTVGAVPLQSQQLPHVRQGARAGVQRALRSTLGASDAFSGSTSSAFGRRPTTGLGLTAVLSATYNAAAPAATGAGSGLGQFQLPQAMLLGPSTAGARLGGPTMVPHTIFTRRGITAKFQKFAPGDTVLRIMPLGVPPAPSRKRSFVTVTTKGAVAVWSVAEHPPADTAKR